MKNKKILIIAEAGVNHNGKLNIAKKLILAASKAGADFIKFQTFNPDEMIIKSTKLANYQKNNLKKKTSQYKMLKKYELNKNWYKNIIDCCKKNNIKFISSPFDISSIRFLKKFNLDYIKIPSGEIDNYPYLKEIAFLKKKTILSTGMSTLNEISFALKTLLKFGLTKNKISILHCHTDYPSNVKDLNLNSIITIKKIFRLCTGYSDHSMGITAPIAAAALGSEIIEKHLTLDRKLSGPDHKASINPREFAQMVISVRHVEKMLGNGKKIPSKSELRNKLLVRKSIVASKKIFRGDKFTNFNITTKRPAKGKSPKLYANILGKISKRNYEKDEFI